MRVVWNHTEMWLCLFRLIKQKGRAVWPKLEGQENADIKSLLAEQAWLFKWHFNYIYVGLTPPAVQRMIPYSYKIPTCMKIKKFTYIFKITCYQRRVSWQDSWPKHNQVLYQLSEFGPLFMASMCKICQILESTGKSLIFKSTWTQNENYNLPPIYCSCPEDKQHIRLNNRPLLLGLAALNIPSPNSLFFTIKTQDSDDF